MNENSIKFSDQTSDEYRYELAVNRIAGQSKTAEVHIIKYEFMIYNRESPREIFKSTAQIGLIGNISNANETEGQYKSILIKSVFNSINKPNFTFRNFATSPDDAKMKIFK